MYWLMKSEPDVFGIEHLKKRPGRTASWDGVRNYQARNDLRAMKRGDFAFFYYSSCPEPGVAAIIKIVKEAYPDHTAWDKKSEYYDIRSTPDKPVWDMVDVKFVRQFERPVLLADLKKHPLLKKMQLVQHGNRLSVMPVKPREWNTIVKLADRRRNQEKEKLK
jgi:predicted RNA-binding protein with PUA-like domain